MKGICIIVSGKKYSGKDTFAKYFRERGFDNFAYADQLKEDLVQFLKISFKTEIPISYFYDTDKKESAIQLPYSENATTYRHLLQWYGEMVKSEFGKYYWIRRVCSRIKEQNSKKIIITDARFPYEIDITKQKLRRYYNFFTIYVDRNIKSDDIHISETSLNKDFGYNWVVDNNGTLEDLEKQCSFIFNKVVSEEEI